MQCKYCNQPCIKKGFYKLVQKKRATELVFGMNANYNLGEFGEKQLLAGLYYRLGDAIVPMVVDLN